jgi:phage terminase large subunit
VWNRARIENSLIVYDAIGVGATSGAKFNVLNNGSKLKIEHQKFFAGGSVAKPEAQYSRSGIKNKNYFCNIKSQAWFLVADRFRNTFNAITNGQDFSEDEMIFIDSNMPHLNILIDELCSPLQDYDNNGRVKVESKKDLAKRGISSPNIADAFIMANLSSDMRRRSFFG